MSEPAATTSDIRFTRRDDSSTQVELLRQQQVVSFLTIIPLTIAVGCARVKVGGIGGVETLEEQRRQGYSRQVLEATIEHLRLGPAALSLLYGIPDFYPKFGFATAGPEYALQLRGLSRPAPLPAGWSARPAQPADLPTLRKLYAEYTANAVGAVVREQAGDVWSGVRSVADGSCADDECHVVVSPTGGVEGYAWRGKHLWPVSEDFAHRFPESLIIGEVIANATPAAEAMLAVCRAWGARTTTPKGEPVKDVVLSFPPEGPIYAAALRQDVRLITASWPAENFMARTLDVLRLLQALQPELTARRRTLRAAVSGTVRLETDIGAAILTVDYAGVSVDAPDGHDTMPPTILRLPQTELMRLALGALPPADVLDRLDPPPNDRIGALLEGLFPQCHPYLHLPDRI